MLTEENRSLATEIEQLKRKNNAIILAHLYQRPEIQEIADVVGDSLELSRRAAETDADTIVFCGVHFMAETAAILSPEKTVLLPELKAGCPMADMVTPEKLRAKKQEMSDALVVCYINTSAEVKAESDICCTSANAEKIVRSIDGNKQIIFIPDKNLGAYIARMTGRALTVWEGWCNTHEWVIPGNVAKAKKEHPAAVVLAHPECQPEVIDMADYVSGTSGLIRFARESDSKEFIIVTEAGILHQLHKHCPDKKFYLATEKLVCPNMKLTTLPKVKQALLTMSPQVKVEPAVRDKALGCLERMLAVK